MAVKIIRDSSLRLKLHPAMKARLETLSDLLGVPPSTLGAVWLGQSIANQERSLSIVSSMAESAGAEIGNAMREQMPSLFAMLSDGDKAVASEPLGSVK